MGRITITDIFTLGVSLLLFFILQMQSKLMKNDLNFTLELSLSPVILFYRITRCIGIFLVIKAEKIGLFFFKILKILEDVIFKLVFVKFI